MTYVEIGGLFASGMNGYLKFADQKMLERYTSLALLTRFNLSDNKPSFVSVSYRRAAEEPVADGCHVWRGFGNSADPFASARASCMLCHLE